MRLEAAKMAIPGGGVCSIDTQHLKYVIYLPQKRPYFRFKYVI